MNWGCLKHFPWLDTRARFVARIPKAGRLLDLGSSDGETLCHIAELRPDLQLFAADMVEQSQKYPAGCQFQQADLQREKLLWPDQLMDAITCMHLVEHLADLTLLLEEAARLLKPGGGVYFETPHPKSLTLPSPRGKMAGTFALNFHDDPTHVRLVTTDMLAQEAERAGLEVETSGTSRNWLFALAYPAYWFLPDSRQKYTAYVHWLGWSAYLIARRSR